MVYIASWQEYQDAAEALYAASPNKTRYVVKWKVSKKTDVSASGSRGQLVLKITDDATCLKYKTSSGIILNRFEALNNELAKRMRNVAPPPPVQPGTTSIAIDTDSAAPDVERTGTPVPGASGQGVASGGVKKKKGKKKK